MHRKSVNEAWESPSQQYQGQNFRSIQVINLTAKACKNIEIISYIHLFSLYKEKPAMKIQKYSILTTMNFFEVKISNQ